MALGLKQLTEDPWLRQIPEHYIPGQIVQGKVTKVTNFGVFVELEEGLEGLLHISELADHKVNNPEEIVKVAEDVEVKILRVDSDDRKIGLSLKRAQWAAEDGVPSEAPTEPVRRRGGLDAESGLLGAAAEKLLSATRKESPPERESEQVDEATAEKIAMDALDDQAKPSPQTEEPSQAEESSQAEPDEKKE